MKKIISPQVGKKWEIAGKFRGLIGIFQIILICCRWKNIFFEKAGNVSRLSVLGSGCLYGGGPALGRVRAIPAGTKLPITMLVPVKGARIIRDASATEARTEARKIGFSLKYIK